MVLAQCNVGVCTHEGCESELKIIEVILGVNTG